MEENIVEKVNSGLKEGAKETLKIGGIGLGVYLVAEYAIVPGVKAVWKTAKKFRDTRKAKKVQTEESKKE